MSGKRVTVRNIDEATYLFLEKRAKELSSDGNNISVNQLIGFILNTHHHNHLLRDELTEIQKLANSINNLTEVISDLVISSQDGQN